MLLTDFHDKYFDTRIQSSFEFLLSIPAKQKKATKTKINVITYKKFLCF
jgi:hypothetical protein